MEAGKIAGLYDLEKTLGRGHFAVVKLARHVFTGEKVAVKVIDKSKLDPMATSHLFQEVRCMKLVQHPNVVRLYEVIDTQTKLYLILELADGGDLYDYIMRHEGGLQEELAKTYFAQVVHAISYCHTLHVVHRDLKPENVVFFKEQGVVKLTDFGFSNRFQPGTKLATSCGSLAYSAPEILLGDEYDAPAVDIWSLGVILYMLVCGYPPFHEVNDSETLTMIMDCRYTVPQHVSTACQSLISRMLQRDPKRRASLGEIESHPWLQGVDPSPAKKLSLPLTSYKSLSDEEHEIIIQSMECGSIADRGAIQEALEADDYNHITATYFLLAERILREKQEKQTQSQNLNLDYNWSSHVQCRQSLSTPITSFVAAMEQRGQPPLPHNGFSLERPARGRGVGDGGTGGAEGVGPGRGRAVELKKIAKPPSGAPGPSPIQILLRSSLEASVTPKTPPVLQQICEEDEEEEEEDKVAVVQVLKGTCLPSEALRPCMGPGHMDIQKPASRSPDKGGRRGAGTEPAAETQEGPRQRAAATEPAARGVLITGLTGGPGCCGRWAEQSEQLAVHFSSRPINLMNESNNNSAGKEGSRAPEPPSTGDREGPAPDSPRARPAERTAEPGVSADPLSRPDPTRAKNVNIRERILQIPLCEKALAFKIKPSSKDNLLPFGQFNCCHVI
ncbi:SNF related kinase b [Callorhinchus milii]|uniref:SNF related kinase b n=1 Tax=Callorhinchus milii TaxID=7868 RepID=UPI001C3FA9FE|nr:SNF related kinase b [Callorhinchus milii]